MAVNIEKFKEIFGKLYAKLMEFSLEEEFLNNMGQSLEIFYDLKQGEEYEFDATKEFLFLTWFLLDVDLSFLDENEDPGYLIDKFIARKADVLSIQEIQICQALKETSLNLLEIKAASPKGDSMTMCDAFTGKTFEVYESFGNEAQAKPGDLLFSRILTLGDYNILVGAGIFLDGSLKEYITQDYTDAYHDVCEKGERCNFKEFLKDNGYLLNHWIKAYERGDLTGDGNGDDEDDNPEGDDNNGDKEK